MKRNATQKKSVEKPKTGLGRPPRQAGTVAKQTNVRMEPELRERLEKHAEKRRVTLSDYVRHCCATYVEMLDDPAVVTAAEAMFIDPDAFIARAVKMAVRPPA